ncbi:TRAP transporter small permease subunit [Stappia sp. MMSF_3263]|uniref:TRAP transporter small permease subunit n=1 Tax=Stappia sp. MMSF_3263 TaxID=3046693 RepID=UPI00273DC283|nr:TRAP transporter small permease [Stappia sp. MMSF_3263]
MAEEIDLETSVEAPTSRTVARGPFALAANALAAIGTIWIFVMMLVIVADVLGRNLFNAPITGVAEVCARSVVAIVFLQVSSAVLSGRMTRADFFVRGLEQASPRVMRLVDALFALVGAAVFLAILYATWPDTVAAWRGSEYFGVQGVFTIPTLPFRAIIVIGSAFAAAAYLAVAASHLVSQPKDDA